MASPQDRKFTKSHEWIKLEGDIAIVGITDYAQETLGDVTYVELPDIGQNVDKGAECAEIESVKAASEIFAPVSGEVTEINEDLEDAPELVNKSPYSKGWIFKLSGVNPTSLDDLLDAAAYDEVVRQEEA